MGCREFRDAEKAVGAGQGCSRDFGFLSLHTCKRIGAQLHQKEVLNCAQTIALNILNTLGKSKLPEHPEHPEP